jgi:hypothetical protein
MQDYAHRSSQRREWVAMAVIAVAIAVLAGNQFVGMQNMMGYLKVAGLF